MLNGYLHRISGAKLVLVAIDIDFGVNLQVPGADGEVVLLSHVLLGERNLDDNLLGGFVADMDRGLDFTPVLVGLLVYVYLHIAVARREHGALVSLVLEVLVLILDVLTDTGDVGHVLDVLVGEHSVDVPQVVYVLVLDNIPQYVELLEVNAFEVDLAFALVGFDEVLYSGHLVKGLQRSHALGVEDIPGVHAAVVPAGVVHVDGALVSCDHDALTCLGLGEVLFGVEVTDAGDTVVYADKEVCSVGRDLSYAGGSHLAALDVHFGSWLSLSLAAASRLYSWSRVIAACHHGHCGENHE